MTVRSVGKSVRRSSTEARKAKGEGGGVPIIQDATADGWWARRRCAFWQPYGVNFKQHHLETQLRDLAAGLREVDPEFFAF